VRNATHFFVFSQPNQHTQLSSTQESPKSIKPIDRLIDYSIDYPSTAQQRTTEQQNRTTEPPITEPNNNTNTNSKQHVNHPPIHRLSTV